MQKLAVPSVYKVEDVSDQLESKSKSLPQAPHKSNETHSLNSLEDFFKSKNIKRGHHLEVKRQWFSHHGIYMGDHKVIHFVPENEGTSTFLELLNEKQFASVKETHFSVFLDQSDLTDVKIVPYPNITDLEEVAKKAEQIKDTKSEGCYNLLSNNCEHLAAYLSTGERKSSQVRNAVYAAGTLLAGAVALFGVVYSVVTATTTTTEKKEDDDKEKEEERN